MRIIHGGTPALQHCGQRMPPPHAQHSHTLIHNPARTPHHHHSGNSAPRTVHDHLAPHTVARQHCSPNAQSGTLTLKYPKQCTPPYHTHRHLSTLALKYCEQCTPQCTKCQYSTSVSKTMHAPTSTLTLKHSGTLVQQKVHPQCTKRHSSTSVPKTVHTPFQHTDTQALWHISTVNSVQPQVKSGTSESQYQRQQMPPPPQ